MTGPEAFKGEEKPRAVAGENVLVSKFSGVIIKGPLDGKIYRLCNDEDIFCGLDGDLSQVIIENPVTKSKQMGGESALKAQLLSERA